LLLAGISLFLFARWKGIIHKVSTRAFFEMIGLGLVVGFHWYTFYHAIKVSNVSVTMAGFASITFFASLLQPLILKKKFFWGDMIYGLVIGVGLIIILNAEQFYAKGIFYGVLAAITSAFFGVYNGKLIKKHDAVTITLIEFLGAFLLITVMILVSEDRHPIFLFPVLSDLLYLLFLGIFCTTIAFTWSISILKQFTPLTVIITNNLEPIYGIVFSVFLFGSSEYMSAHFYEGAAIILISVFTYPLIQRKFKIKS
jgi:drug/metabolite transporter (DMT)-like permease